MRARTSATPLPAAAVLPAGPLAAGAAQAPAADAPRVDDEASPVSEVTIGSAAAAQLGPPCSEGRARDLNSARRPTRAGTACRRRRRPRPAAAARPRARGRRAAAPCAACASQARAAPGSAPPAPPAAPEQRARAGSDENVVLASPAAGKASPLGAPPVRRPAACAGLAPSTRAPELVSQPCPPRGRPAATRRGAGASCAACRLRSWKTCGDLRVRKLAQGAYGRSVTLSTAGSDRPT